MKSVNNEIMPKSFNILDKGALSKILENLNPSDVLNICTLDDRFEEICKDQNIFRNLMLIHYPYSHPTSNPKLQYEALTYNINNRYYIDILATSMMVGDTEGNEDIQIFFEFDEKANSFDPKNIQPPNQLIFDIPGLKSSIGDKYVISIKNYYTTFETQSYLTEEQAINDFLDNEYYVYLDIVLDHFLVYLDLIDYKGHLIEYVNTLNIKYMKSHNFDKVLNSKELKNFCKVRKYPQLLTKKHLFEYIYYNHFLSTSPDSADEYTIVYQFRTITIVS